MTENRDETHGLYTVGKASNLSCIKNNSLLSTKRLNLRNVVDSELTACHTILHEVTDTSIVSGFMHPLPLQVYCGHS